MRLGSPWSNCMSWRHMWSICADHSRRPCWCLLLFQFCFLTQCMLIIQIKLKYSTQATLRGLTSKKNQQKKQGRSQHAPMEKKSVLKSFCVQDLNPKSLTLGRNLNWGTSEYKGKHGNILFLAFFCAQVPNSFASLAWKFRLPSSKVMFFFFF